MSNQNQSTSKRNSNRNANGYRFSPIFDADVTPGPVEILTGQKGDYARMRGTTVTPNGKPAKTITLMAFGKSLEAIRDVLEEGKTIPLAVQYDGGSMKAIGFQLPKADNEDAPEAEAA